MYLLNTLGITINICVAKEEGYKSLPKNDETGEYKKYFC